MRVKLNKGPTGSRAGPSKWKSENTVGEKLPKYCGSQWGSCTVCKSPALPRTFLTVGSSLFPAVFDNWRSTALWHKLNSMNSNFNLDQNQVTEFRCVQTGPTLTQLIRGKTQVCSAGTWRCDHWPMSNQLQWGR